MATITTSWATYASKTFKPGTGLSVTFQLQARQTAQSAANNTSTIQTRLRSVVNSGQGNGYNYKFTCSYASSVSGSGLWTLQTETITTSSNKVISHNNDGTKTISLSATAVISGLSMNLSMSANVNLQKINRIADLTSWPNLTDETNPTIKFTNPANYKIDISFYVYDKNGHSVTDFIMPIGRYTSPYTIDMSGDWDSIRQDCTTQKVYDAVVGITTYDNNENEIGNDYVNRTLTIVNANPTFTPSYKDINNTTTAITGDNQKIIRNQSDLQLDISNAEGKKYATLTGLKAVINGITYNGTLNGTTGTIPVGTLDVSDNIEASITLTDSRGYETTENIEIEVLNWELPTANITLARQNNYYSETDIKVDANYSSLDGDNTITIQVRYKKQEDENYSAWQSLSDNVTSTLILDNLYEWDVQVKVTDLFGNTTYNLTLDKGMPIIYFDRLKRSVSINSLPQNTESLEVLGGDILEIIGDKTDTWSSGGSYAKDSFVTYERYIYKNKTGSNSGTPDTDTTNWDKVSILDLINSVSSGGGGGTTNYNDLGNKPSINNVTLSGNKSLSDLGINIPTTTSQLTNNSGFITNSVNDLTNYTKTTDLATVATSGSYTDLSNKPTIPTVNNATLTIQKNGATIDTFTANSSTNKTVNVTVPTTTNDLTNDSGFITGIDSHDIYVAQGYTSQEELVSGVNIKTINSNSLLGSGDISVSTFSGNYNDLTNKPTIPTTTSQLTNDSGYITGITSGDVTTALGYTPEEELETFNLSDILAITSTSDSTYTKLLSSLGKPFNISKNGNVKPNTIYEVIGTNDNAIANRVIEIYFYDENNDYNIITLSATSGNVTVTQTTTSYQEEITNSNKLDYSLITNTPTIGNAKTYYGVCNTGSYIGTKEVTISDFILETGATVIIKFTYGNDYTNTPLLKINSEDSKYMKIGFNTLTYKWGMDAVLTFVYDGSNFILIEPEKATSDKYGLTTLTDSVSSTSTTSAATPNSVKQAYDLANSKQDALVSGTNIKTINGSTLLGSGDITIGGGGTSTDVKINGTSITSSGEADIITEGTYNSSTNKIATMSEIPTNTSELNNDNGFITSSDLPQDSGWQTITPTNGTAGTGYYIPQYRKIGKLVTMRGYITVRNNTAMFSLPNAYRPSARLTFAGTNDNLVVNEIRITEAGNVQLLRSSGTLSSGVPCFLDNISYFVD